MLATFRAADAILTLVQLVPIIVLSVASFRVRYRFTPPFHRAARQQRGVADSRPLQLRVASAETNRRWGAQNSD